MPGRTGLSERGLETGKLARLRRILDRHGLANGTARLSTNAMVPEIGAELATSRALAALGHRLLELTAEDLAALPTSTPVRG